MFNQQNPKFRHLMGAILAALLISTSSYATSPVITTGTILEESGIPADSLLNKRFVVSNKDLISSFNDRLISKPEMDAFLKRQMESLNIPGLSIAFINDDKILYHNALGVKNTETQEKVDHSTIFDAASMSKTVFSFFTMKMVDDGLLDLDTPLYTYMEYKDIAYDDRHKLITARMVLSHTSGFPLIGDFWIKKEIMTQMANFPYCLNLYKLKTQALFETII